MKIVNFSHLLGWSSENFDNIKKQMLIHMILRGTWQGRSLSIICWCESLLLNICSKEAHLILASGLQVFGVYSASLSFGGP